MLYEALKKFAASIFNLLNLLLRGNLPPFGCVCIIVEKEQRFLVIERQSGKVVFPGGFMRWSECPEQTVIREGKEETGLQLRPLRILGHFSASSQRMDRISTLDIVYQAEVIDGQLRKSVEGRPYWVNKEDLLEKLAPHYLNIYQDYLRYCEQHSEVRLHKV